MLEREIKFAIDRREYEALRSVKQLHSGLTINSNCTFERPYVYFDTRDQLFRKTGVTVSVRRREEDCVMTYKIPQGSVEVREEEPLVLPYGAFPESLDEELMADEEVRKFLSPISQMINGAALKCILNLSVTNTRVVIYRGGLYVLELSVAKCVGDKGERSAIMYEAEVELEEDGGEDDLTTFSGFLEERFQLERLIENKYQCMMSLLD